MCVLFCYVMSITYGALGLVSAWFGTNTDHVSAMALMWFIAAKVSKDRAA